MIMVKKSVGMRFAAAMLAVAGGGFLAAGMQDVRAAQLDKLIGAWKGQGTAVFEGNRSERINCRAYYTGGGEQLNIAVRCASTSYKIEIRSKLEKNGAQLSGTWEERTFNASGATTGTINEERMRLAVEGGGLQASMTVNYGGDNQQVRIRTRGVQLQSVSIVLARN
jgi:hypothetical protein